MLVLDTDTFSLLQHPGDTRARILRVIEESGHSPVITIVTVEQALCGWINRIDQNTLTQQVPLYARLGSLVELFKRWPVLPFDEAAAAKAAELKHQWTLIGMPDVKIAAIVLG